VRAAFLAGLLAVAPCLADEDEAWLRRADVPAGTRPLLAVLLDRSAATTGLVDVPAPFDPQIDYGAGLAADARCDGPKFYVRRGPGPAPDCLLVAPLETLACDVARAPLATYGYFAASPATTAECLAHAAGRVVDAHVFYTGNFLNYLLSAPPWVSQPGATAFADRLADALAATAGLDAALLVTDDDGPGGAYVAIAPVASEVAAARIPTLVMTPPAGDPALAESLGEAARWLRGDAVQSGNDGRADPAALDPRAAGRYASPFDTACKPVSLALLTASDLSSGEQLLAAELGAADLREDLPGMQSAPLLWSAPGLGFSPPTRSPGQTS